MSPNDDKPMNKAVWIGCLCLLVIAAAAGVTFWLNKTESSPDKASQEPVIAQDKPGQVRKPIVESPPESVATAGKPANAPMPESPQPEPEQPQPVVDYDRLKKDKNLQAVMEKRKEDYGIEKGVDLIVTPDESVKVGDTVVPMKEILDRIRLKSGEVLEKDLTEPSAENTAGEKREELISELDTVKERYQQLDKTIKHPKQTQSKETKETYVKEREALGKIVSVYEDYKKTTEKLEEKKRLLAAITESENTPSAPASAVEKDVPEKPVPSVDSGSTPVADEPAGESTWKKETVTRSVPGPETPADKKDAGKAAMTPSQKISKKQPRPEAVKSAAPAPSAVSPGSGVSEAAPAAAATAPSVGATKTPTGVPAPIVKAPTPVIKTETPSLKAPEPTVAPGLAKASKPSLRAEKRRINIEALKKAIREEINTLMLKKGDLENELMLLLKKEKRPEAYGIYVVQQKDNIWNIHYKFLKDYFEHRKVRISGDADEPDTRGRSSGVGKILKFSEKMVYIYNIRERELTSNIDLIHPLSKIVVFNMSKVFELLKDSPYQDMDEIQFDGENIWLPAKS